MRPIQCFRILEKAQKDTGLWPAYDGDDVITVASQTKFKTPASLDLGATTADFSLPNIDPGAAGTAPANWATGTGDKDDMANHLSVDNPGDEVGGTCVKGGVGAKRYRENLNF